MAPEDYSSHAERATPPPVRDISIGVQQSEAVDWFMRDGRSKLPPVDRSAKKDVSEQSPIATWDAAKDELTLTLRPAGNTVWLAHVPPYPNARLAGLLAEIGRTYVPVLLANGAMAAILFGIVVWSFVDLVRAKRRNSFI